MRLTEIGAGGKAMGEIDGVRHAVDVSLLETPRVGQYVIVHAGYAIGKLDAAEAKETLALLEELALAAGDAP
jgi:hydrogenase expression/formation protein HypC